MNRRFPRQGSGGVARVTRSRVANMTMNITG